MRKTLFITILVTLLLSSCDDDRINQESNIPYAPVRYSINMMQSAPELAVAGGFHTATEPRTYDEFLGYGGLVIFHAFDDQFYAYDLSCPHECKKDVRVEPSMAGIATCPECGSTFDIGFGTGFPTKGEAQYPLKRYTIIVSGYNIRVTY